MGLIGKISFQWIPGHVRTHGSKQRHHWHDQNFSMDWEEKFKKVQKEKER